MIPWYLVKLNGANALNARLLQYHADERGTVSQSCFLVHKGVFRFLSIHTCTENRSNLKACSTTRKNLLTFPEDVETVPHRLVKSK